MSATAPGLAEARLAHAHPAPHAQHAAHAPRATPAPRALPPLTAWPAPVLAGCLALLAAALLAWWLSPRWQADAAQARADRQAHIATWARTRAARPAPLPAPQHAQRLLQALPDADATPQRITALLALAAQRGVSIDSARQTPAPASAAAGLPVTPVGLTLVARGSPAALRQFVAQALQNDDALVLVQWRMQRNQPTAREPTADLQWQLLQRSVLPGGKR